ncbi:MAG: tetratricopeptide repeat-containing sensor histidine kinase [Bacteroidetes bacterium]|nr:tetratricopeptide repeat-containing sensor histidine kinase [Bacteroidota bacterium]MBT6685141.1 tetratricopeptide repeat-containing sensor histidine kinase [Bacteroidota bacterium]MBT7142052.1 tetratricopeptide repeat-containing sensor histidine kinase [Bacteroidota bacterium]MBT7493374.1 tetratricopeptide repeat-containing sensor histidine kinase [Bacteroidota bacterium]
MKKFILILVILFSGFILTELNAQTTEIDSLENLLQKHTTKDTIRVNLLNELANEYFRQDAEKKLKCAEEAKTLSDQLDYKKGEALSLIYCGSYYYYMSDFPTATKYVQNSLEISKKEGFDKVIGKGYNFLGQMSSEKGNYKEALDCFDKSLKNFEKINYKNGIASAFTNLGIVFWRQGNYPNAVKYYQKAMKIYEDLNDKIEIAKCENNIGIIFTNQGEYDKALNYLKRALSTNEEIDNLEEVSKCLMNIGAVYFHMEDLTQALEYWTRTLKIYKKLGNKRNISQCLTNIGVVYFNREDYSLSAEYYEKALEISQEIDDKPNLSLSYQNISGVYLKAENYHKALKYAYLALDIANEIGELNRKMEVQNLFYEIYLAKTDYRKALESHVLFKLYADSLINENNIAEITSLEKQYEFDKEKQAIEAEQKKKDAIQAEEARRKQAIRNYLMAAIGLMVLVIVVVMRSFLQKRKANRILASQKTEIENKNNELITKNEEIRSQSEQLEYANEKLKELDEFKEEMTGMIVHDLKNPLNSIIGLSENPIVEQSGKQMLNMVTNILDVQKYENAKIQLKKSNCSLNLISESALQQINLLYIEKNITIKNYLQNYNVLIDKEIVERVFVNILTNAIKYTPNNGNIILESFKESSDLIQIKITDTGEGIPPDKLDKVFGKFEQVLSRNSGLTASTGIGLTFCKLFVEAHGGEIGLESEVGTGTTIWFTLPLGKQEDVDISIKKSLPEEKNIELTQKDKNILVPFQIEFRKYEVFEFSDIEEILEQIDFSKTIGLTKWKEEIDNALYGLNQEKYLSLIKMID